ncbi:uncharacterized protein BDFB_007429, partial [Asbolus verrucosus]
ESGTSREEPEAATSDSSSSEEAPEPAGERILQLKITLKYIKPSIWRLILVSSEDTFYNLHSYIQKMMGWSDRHLHQFVTKSMTRIVQVDRSENGAVFYDLHRDSDLREDETKLSTFFSEVGDRVMYMYHFADKWQHKIVLEDILPRMPNTAYPVCVTGKRACPLEDCGGVMGYQHLLEVWANPEHAEYEHLLNWLENVRPNFNPENFDPNITLKYVNPPIWRRILVSSEDTFYDLHCNIQRAMGWDDLHSHQFTTRSSVLIVPIDPNDDDEVFYNFHMGPVLEERKTKLSTFLSKVGNSVVYLYDFMNGWQHKIVLEDILDKEPKTTYPKCVGGMRACPPEECGGVTGYHHLVQVWGNPQHKDYEALINNWLQDMCPNFDPDRFDPNIPFNPTFKF